MVFNVHITQILEKPGAADSTIRMKTTDIPTPDINVVSEFVDRQENPDLISGLKNHKNVSSVASASQSSMERKYPIRIFTIQPEG